MKHKHILSILFLVIAISILPWCGSTSNNSDPNTNQNQSISNFILSPSVTNKYKKITKNWNLQENLELQIKSDTDTTLLDLNISSTTEKNIISWYQSARYFFNFNNLNKTFQEKNIISWYINLLSLGSKYFIQPQNISFYWPEWKLWNQSTQTQIDEVNDKRILLDKDVPFKGLLSTMLDFQRSFYQSLLSWEKINLSWNSNLELQVINKKIYLTYHTSKWTLKSELKIKKTFKGIKVYFDGELLYHLPNTTKEIKLDIKWKYTINKSQYKQINLPQNYIYFTQTSLTK